MAEVEKNHQRGVGVSPQDVALVLGATKQVGVQVSNERDGKKQKEVGLFPVEPLQEDHDSDQEDGKAVKGKREYFIARVNARGHHDADDKKEED